MKGFSLMRRPPAPAPSALSTLAPAIGPVANSLAEAYRAHMETSAQIAALRETTRMRELASHDLAVRADVHINKVHQLGELYLHEPDRSLRARIIDTIAQPFDGAGGGLVAGQCIDIDPEEP